MSKLIAPCSVGAVYVIIALFSLGALQPIDCKEDQKLFANLNKALSVEAAEELLDAVKKKDQVTLIGATVSRLLEIRDKPEEDCRYELLLAGYDNYQFYWGRWENKGLKGFLKYHLVKRARRCFDMLVANLKAAVENGMDANERNVAEEFLLRLEPFNPFEQYDKKLHDRYMTLAVQAWNVLSSKENKAKLQSSCMKLNDILNGHFPPYLWKSYTNWLFYQEVESYGWTKVGMACSVYLTLLEEKSGELALWYGPVKKS